MADQKRKEAIAAICQRLSERMYFPFGDWEMEDSRTGQSMTTKYWHKDKELVINLFFNWDNDLCDFRLTFLGFRSRYLARKFGLRPIISLAVQQYLESFCIATDHFALYVTQRT